MKRLEGAAKKPRILERMKNMERVPVARSCRYDRDFRQAA
jgi:hypothetical protein